MTWCLSMGAGRRVYACAALAAVTVFAGCEFPTEAPIFESRFVLPAETATLSVSELLPDSVTDSGATFSVVAAPSSTSRTLGQLCPACVPFNGLSVPYPGFTATITDVVTLPTDVGAATIVNGVIQVSVTNQFGFDPLMPPGATTVGTIRVQATNNGRTIGDTTITGAFAPGLTRGIAVNLAPGEVSGPVNVMLTIVSPAGGTAPQHFVTIDASGSLGIVSAPTNIAISSADVAVDQTAVSIASVDLDLSDVDETLAERTQSGAMIVKVSNPFAVSGNLTLRITGGTAGEIVKSLVIPVGGVAIPTTTQSVPFTGPELQSILGQDVSMSISGTVSGATPFVTVVPGQVVTFETLLDLVVRTGGDDE